MTCLKSIQETLQFNTVNIKQKKGKKIIWKTKLKIFNEKLDSLSIDTNNNLSNEVNLI